MRSLFFIFFLLLLKLHAQDINAFNSKYNKTYLETSQTDFKKAVQVADSLFRISETPALKARSLMLSATLYSQSGEFEKSLQYALQAKDIIEETDNATAKAKIFGFLINSNP